MHTHERLIARLMSGRRRAGHVDRRDGAERGMTGLNIGCRRGKRTGRVVDWPSRTLARQWVGRREHPVCNASRTAARQHLAARWAPAADLASLVPLLQRNNSSLTQYPAALPCPARPGPVPCPARPCALPCPAPTWLLCMQATVWLAGARAAGRSSATCTAAANLRRQYRRHPC